MIVTFRSPDGVVLDDAPLRLVTPSDDVYELSLADAPTRSREGDVVVDAVTYELDSEAMMAANRYGREADLVVLHGGQVRTYPLVRSDLIE